MRYIFDTVLLNLLDETQKNKTSLKQFKILIGRMRTVAGVFCARLWEVMHPLCHFFK